MAFVFVTSRRGGNISQTSTTMTVFKKVKGASAPQLSFKLSTEDMIKNRWVIGDRLDIAFDDENQCKVLMRRSPKGEFAISSGDGIKAHGKTISGNCKFTLPKTLPFIEDDKFLACASEITSNGFVVTFERCI